MLRKILKWLFKKEADEIAALLEDARKTSRIRYVQCQAYDMKSSEFLVPILEFTNLPQFTFWMVERKRQYEFMIKYGKPMERDLYIGRAMAVDEILKDTEDFIAKRIEMLEKPKEAVDVEQI